VASAPAMVKIGERGGVTLPAEVRRAFGLERGDVVAVTATPDGILLVPRHKVVEDAMSEIGRALREQGLTLDDMIERGRAIRGELLEEQYGLRDADEA
jgi:AbrB family looped-hinge helix DNA binding protein